MEKYYYNLNGKRDYYTLSEVADELTKNAVGNTDNNVVSCLIKK